MINKHNNVKYNEGGGDNRSKSDLVAVTFNRRGN